MKTCKRVACLKEFEPAHGNQKYCSKRCAMLQNSRNQYHRDPDAGIDATKRWAANNPERVKEIYERKTKKRYVTGKLPPWMYS